MATTKPDVNEIWARSGAVIDPGVPKIQLGWIAEVPTFQNFNFILNRQDTFNKHINEEGIAVHDLDTNYPEFALAKGSDGTIYRAKQVNSNEDPVLDIPETFWEPAFLEASALGTAAFEDVGATIGDVVQLEDVGGNPGMPVVDASQLTGLVGVGIATAWVNFNGAGVVAIRSSFNVSSITDLGTGNYTVNMINAVGDTDYAVVSSCQQGNSASNGDNNATVSTGQFAKTTTSFFMYSVDNGANTAVDSVTISASVLSN